MFQSNLQDKDPRLTSTKPVRIILLSRNDHKAFTLIELLVVIAIIGILFSILLPALSAARFRSKTTLCSNNYRQWTVAANTYASDDTKGRLPSFSLPADKMPNYEQIEPSWVSFAMGTNMNLYGVTLSQWFCPLRPKVFQNHNEVFKFKTGRSIVSTADLVEEFQTVQKAHFISADFLWWVPRQVAETGLYFPDPAVMIKRTQDPWPRRIDESTISTEPIITDWIIGAWDDATQRPLFEDNRGGHAKGNRMPNLNLGFADGHVETRISKALQWQAKGNNKSHIYVY